MSVNRYSSIVGFYKETCKCPGAKWAVQRDVARARFCDTFLFPKF